MAEKHTHTPGPWVAYHQNDHHEWQIGAGLSPDKADNDGHFEFIVAQTFGGLGIDDSESEANARLIAQAPAMIDVLRKLAAEVGGLRAFEGELRAEISNTNWNVLMMRLLEADAVVAAATGEAP